jgi:crotonobetainyl-CoA:carnitine CoA-transferase CaiB-like acyl-CoA transferase
MLGGYRVLDLTEGGCLICAKMLGDLGADVIKIEPPEGSPTRNMGPFYGDIAHPEKSLFWYAFNTNKKGVTLNIETVDGRELFKRLVKTADFLIESFDPGYMDSLGLGSSALEQVNPRLVMVAITPFGQTGPYRGYRANDMVIWALGGAMFVSGDLDGPPNQITFPHAYLHGGAEAATAALIAHYHRERTGEGQYVDVSIQQCMSLIGANSLPYWEMYEIVLTRGIYKSPIPRPDGTTIYIPLMWPCKEGWVIFYPIGGASFAESTSLLVQWMDEEGMAGELKGHDFSKDSTVTITQEDMDRQRALFEAFFMKRTQQEIYEQAIKRKIMVAPVSSPKELAENPHLAARDFYVKIGHPELADTLTYCGAFAKSSDTPLSNWRRAPLIGEHNRDIYEKELGLSREQLMRLKQANII